VLTGMTLTDGTDHTDNYSQTDPYPIELTLTAGVVSGNYTADFGYKTATPLTVSGTVFKDTNHNGTLGAEPSVPGASVYLYLDLNGDGKLDPNDPLIGTTTSAGNGSYSFADLPSGKYILSTNVSNTTANGNFQTTQTGTGGVQPVTLTDANSTAQDFGFYAKSSSPTAATLASFTGEATTDGIALTWETESEVENAGFDLYRAESAAGPWTKLNAELIASAAPGGSAGATYHWTDPTAVAGQTNFYRLDAVAVDGSARTLKVISVFNGVFDKKILLPIIMK
jgi:hypothetical protein